MSTTQPARSFWPIGIIAFFVVAITFIVSFIAWATHQHEDLVAENYYDNEVQFQKQLDQLNRTLPLGAQASVAYESASRCIVITLPLSQEQNASGLIQLYRPSDASLDRSVPLALNRGGVQYLDAKALPGGLWKIRVRWSVRGEDFFLDRSVIVTNPS